MPQIVKNWYADNEVWLGLHSMCKDLLQARRSGVRSPVGANFLHLFRSALESTQPPVE